MRRCTCLAGLLFTAFLAAPLGACRENDDPEGAKQLFSTISQGQGWQAWRRAPAYPRRKPSFTDHGDEVEVFVNPMMSSALDTKTPITQWPPGSIIVKESFSGGSRSAIAVMSKQPDNSWYWAEYDADGEPLYSGKPSECV